MTARLLLADLGHEVLLTHCMLWGAALLAEDAGFEVTLSWTESLSPRPVLVGICADDLGRVVHDHAERAQRETGWMLADLPHEPGRALFSPRVKPFGGTDVWENVQRARHDYMNTLTAQHSWLDLRLINSLGEPAYWRFEKDGARPDDGASRLEMQSRNNGSEFVGTRLRKLARAIVSRTPQAVADGLSGATVRDEAEGDKADSRSATGLRSPQPTDNAVAWCALWGLAMTSVAHQTASPSATATHLTRGRQSGAAGTQDGQFLSVLWSGPWTGSRLSAVLTSAALCDCGRVLTEGEDRPAAAGEWLREHGVRGLVVFPVGRFGSAKAPERRALTGSTFPLPAGPG